MGAEQLLGLGPFQWFGKRSYSLYLWHWPILVIVAERAGTSSLPFRDNLWLVLLAIVISMASYRVVENPIRHWKLPPRTTVAAAGSCRGGGALDRRRPLPGDRRRIGLRRRCHPSPPHPNVAAVLHEVAAAKSITTVPDTIDPSLAQAGGDWGGGDEPASCSAGPTQSTQSLCILGDTHARRLLIVYGDSHALMWLPAFQAIATHAHMRLLVLGKPDCPASLITVSNPPGVGSAASPYGECDNWHKWAVRTIDRLSPSILVVSQDSTYTAPGPVEISPQRWSNGLTALFSKIPSARTEKIYLGNIPLPSSRHQLACRSI